MNKLSNEVQERIKSDAERYAGLMAWVNQDPEGNQPLFHEYISSTSYIAGATAEVKRAQVLVDALEWLKSFARNDMSAKFIDKVIQRWKGKDKEPFTQFSLECAITAITLSVMESGGEYFKAGDGKRFVAFRWDQRENKAFLSIREDGDTRYVFNGVVTSVDDFRKAWQLTILLK